MQFGEKLKALRAEKDLSQVEVANRIGMSRRAYIAYEQDGVYPRKREIYHKLAEVFGCDPNYLLTEDEEFLMQAGAKYGSRGKRQAEELIADVTGFFAGGDVAEEDLDEMMKAIQAAYWIAKEKNKKYTRKDYQTD